MYLLNNLMYLICFTTQYAFTVAQPERGQNCSSRCAMSPSVTAWFKAKYIVILQASTGNFNVNSAWNNTVYLQQCFSEEVYNNIAYPFIPTSTNNVCFITRN